MLRFGLFGAGRIGRVHAASLARHPRTELAVVYDPVEAAAREVAALYGATPTRDADAILGDPDIDAVIIASPTPTHVDLLTACAQAGQAVLCEKPIDLDLARVDACWAAIKGVDATVMVGVNSRRCSFGYDQRLEAFGAEAMLSAGNQTATAVRRSGASGTETAAPYLNFFLDRYATAYQAELDHLVSCVEQGVAPSPGFADGRAALVLADAANESLRTGRAVRIDAGPASR